MQVCMPPPVVCPLLLCGLQAGKSAHARAVWSRHVIGGEAGAGEAQWFWCRVPPPATHPPHCAVAFINACTSDSLVGAIWLLAVLRAAHAAAARPRAPVTHTSRWAPCAACQPHASTDPYPTAFVALQWRSCTTESSWW
jgi:hypothetical protein